MDDVRACPICGNIGLTTFLHCIDHSVTKEAFIIVKCPECDLGITSPRPNNLDKYYSSEEYISHTSQGNTLINKLYLTVRKYTLTEKVKLINQHSTIGELLDYGCGTGDFLKTAEKHRWKITGIEPSEKARRLAEVAIANIFPDLPKDEIRYDAITLWHVLEHIPKLNETIDRLKWLLNPDGTIFLALPNLNSYDAKHYSQLWAGYDVPRHLWHFSRHAVEKILKKHALKVVAIKPMKFDAYYVSMLSEKYRGNSSSLILAKGIRNGLFSNVSAKKTGDYSSLIYIVKK